jgi:hypothetical protein
VSSGEAASAAQTVNAATAFRDANETDAAICPPRGVTS